MDPSSVFGPTLLLGSDGFDDSRALPLSWSG